MPFIPAIYSIKSITSKWAILMPGILILMLEQKGYMIKENANKKPLKGLS